MASSLCSQPAASAAHQQRQNFLPPARIGAVRQAAPFTAAAKPARRCSVAAKAAASLVGSGAGAVPSDYATYETMIVLRPDMSDEQRDIELAKFEAFLKKENSQNVRVTVRGKQRLAYPIKRFYEGIYVLYSYDAAPRTSQAVQKVLSSPEAGAELNILRHMTFRS